MIEYSIGQEVRVIADYGSGHEFTTGTIVRITKTFEADDGNYFYAEYLDGSDWWAVTDTEIEPV